MRRINRYLKNRERTYVHNFLDSDTCDVKLIFFSVINAICQTSEGLIETFLETFQTKGVSDVIRKKIVYFASERATVNSVLKNGFITKMR